MYNICIANMSTPVDVFGDAYHPSNFLPFGTAARFVYAGMQMYGGTRRRVDETGYIRGAGGGARSRALGAANRKMYLPLVKGAWVGKRATARRVGPSVPLAIVQRQLALGVTNWCVQSHVTAARFTGVLNAQMVQTLSRTAKNFLRASTVTGTNRWESYAGLVEMVQSGGTYWNPSTDCLMDTYYPVRSGSAATAVAYPFPRQTWELGTAFQLRDYLCNAYGLLGAGTSGLSGGTLMTGYMPPHIGAGPSFTAYPVGAPDFTASTGSGNDLGPYARGYNTTDVTSLAYLREFERRTPLYLQYESIDFQFRNPTEQVQYVTVFELVPRDDVPMAQTKVGFSAGDAANMGAWPDPKYLWDEWMRVYESTSNQAGGRSFTTDPPTIDVLQTADWPESVVTADAAVGYVSAKPIRTKNTPGMDPGHLVHKFYRVRARSIKLDAGCSGALSFKLWHGRVLRAKDLFEVYAPAGKSALYMMRVKGERLISKATAGSAQTSDGYAAPDVLVEWRKNAKFCKYNMKPQVHRVMVSRPIRSDVTAQYDVDPESGDAEPTSVIA